MSKEVIVCRVTEEKVIMDDRAYTYDFIHDDPEGKFSFMRVSGNINKMCVNGDCRYVVFDPKLAKLLGQPIEMILKRLEYLEGLYKRKELRE